MKRVRSGSARFGAASLLALAAAAPAGATEALSVLCDGNDVTPLNGVLVVQCEGDLLVRHGSFESASAIVLSAGGSLRLEGAWLAAPSMNLSAGLISFDAGSHLAAPLGGSIGLSAGALVAPGGSTVSSWATVGGVAPPPGALVRLPLNGAPVVSLVPESPAGLLLLAGLLPTLVLAYRQRRQRLRSAR